MVKTGKLVTIGLFVILALPLLTSCARQTGPPGAVWVPPSNCLQIREKPTLTGNKNEDLARAYVQRGKVIDDHNDDKICLRESWAKWLKQHGPQE